MAAPSRVNFNNVVSMGISYDWSHGLKDGAPLPCPGITNQPDRPQNFIERIKTIDLEVANLDLNNEGGSVISQLANQQSQYVNTSTHSVYANGQFAGNGYLTSYSISEGSLSNASITNLSHSSKGGEEDPNEGGDEDDPVTRSESIKVSRDIQSKSYQINHSYSVSYGSDFNLVSDFPLYADDPNYKSVAGRLALAEQEASAAIGNNPIDYNQYIDLSPYLIGQGFNLTKINDACSGVFTTERHSRDYINGNYSKDRNITLKYTGADIDPNNIDLYTIDYSISWSQKNDDKRGPCLVFKFDGNIQASSPPDNCSTALSAGVVAESGYKEWVGEAGGVDYNSAGSPTKPKGVAAVEDFYNAMVSSLSFPSASGYPLISQVLKKKKKECVPSVDKGAKNDGQISFNFEMSTCPEIKGNGGKAYTDSLSTSLSNSIVKCANQDRKVTEVSSQLSIQGLCGQQLVGLSGYKRWESIQEPLTRGKTAAGIAASGLYDGPFSGSLRLQSISETEAKYEGKADYTIVYTDNPLDSDCNANNTSICNLGYTSKVSIELSPSIPKYTNTITTVGIISERKGVTLARRDVSIKVNSTGVNNKDTLREIMSVLNCEAQRAKPSCLIDSASLSITKNVNEFNGTINMGGVDS